MKRRNFIIVLLVLLFSLTFSSNKLNYVKDSKGVSAAYPKNRRYKVTARIDQVEDYKYIYDGYIYDQTFLSANNVYSVYSEDLESEGMYDSSDLILVGKDLLNKFTLGDIVEITYINVELTPAIYRNGNLELDAQLASLIVDIKRK